MASWFARYISSLFWVETRVVDPVPPAIADVGDADSNDAAEPSFDIFELFGFVPTAAYGANEQTARQVKEQYMRAFDFAFPLMCSQYGFAVRTGLAVLKSKAPLVIEPISGMLHHRRYNRNKRDTGFTCIKLPSHCAFLISASWTRNLLNEITSLLLLLLDSATTHFHIKRTAVYGFERRIRWFSDHPEFAPYVDSALSRVFS